MEEGPENIFKWAMWNPIVICNLASSKRNGMVCSCEADQKPAGGSFNWAVFFVFEDGVQWVLRSPFHSKKSGIAPALSTSLIKSEVATLKYLKKHTDIPVPTVHAFSPDANNGAGIPFILMDKAPGRPFSKVWSSGEARDKVLRQLGKFAWQLAQHRFDQLGSLFSTGVDSFALGKCLSRGHVLHERYRPGLINGPFNKPAPYWESLFAAFRDQMESVGPRAPHCFVAPKLKTTDFAKGQYDRAWKLRENFLAVGQKQEAADNRIDYLIAAQIAQDLLSQWTHTNPATTLSKPFALQHPDLSVNNVFVDDAYNITCIIDWEFCTTVPLEVLFSPPGFPQSRHELPEWFIGKFQEAVRLAASRAYLAGGREAGPPLRLMAASLRMTSPDSLELSEKAALISSHDRLLDAGRFFWPLTRLVNFDSTEEHKLLAALWEGSPRPEGDGLSLAARFSRGRASPRYRFLWKMVHRNCLPEETAWTREEAHFHLGGEQKKYDWAIARKLTVVSDWRTQYTGSAGGGIRREGGLFVADVKLWKWVMRWEEGYWGLYGPRPWD